MYCSMFCSAVMGVPQAMEPISGTCTMVGSGSKPGGQAQGASSPSRAAGVVSSACASSSTLDWGRSLMPFSSLVMEERER